MTATRIKYASPAQAEADLLLQEIGASLQEIARCQADLELMLERVRATPPYQARALDLSYHQERLRQQDLELKSLLQENRRALFTLPGDRGSCSVELPEGTLLYDKADYVVKPRKVSVLDNLLRYGFDEALRFSVAVDWDALADRDEWPDAALAMIGTRREVKETYGYEVKEV